MKNHLKVCLFLVLTLITLTACSPDMELINEDTTPHLKKSDLQPYIKDISYEVEEKEEGEYPVVIKVKATEEVHKLPEEDIFKLLADTIAYIAAYAVLPECGTPDCDYDKLEVTSGDNVYKMNFTMSNTFEQLTLVVNDNKELHWSDFITEPSTSTTTVSSSGYSDLEIYQWMKRKYDEVTNYGNNYVPEVHDKQVAQLAGTQFNITEQEAGDIYIRMEMKSAGY